MPCFGANVQPMLEMKSTRCEYELKDESGYRFKITAEQAHFGAWQADVTFGTSGFNSAEAAVMHLKSAAEHFIRMLQAARDAQP